MLYQSLERMVTDVRGIFEEELRLLSIAGGICCLDDITRTHLLENQMREKNKLFHKKRPMNSESLNEVRQKSVNH